MHPEDTQGAGADLSRVEFVICWSPPPGLLQQVGGSSAAVCLLGLRSECRSGATGAALPSIAQCPNLKGIQSMGAGVDHCMHDATLPRHVPLLRVIDPLMSERMATWVLWGVINVQASGGGSRKGQPLSSAFWRAALKRARAYPRW